MTIFSPSVVSLFSPALCYQLVQGLSIADYQSDESNNQNTLTTSIAACMTNVPATAIQNLQASSYSTVALTAESTAAIAISYVVHATLAGATYASLSAQLSQSISSGYFNSVLRTTAVTNSAVYLINATSNAVTTTEIVGSDDDACSDCLGTGAIVGIAVGVGVAFCGLVAVCLWFTVYRKGRAGVTRDDIKLPLV